MTRTRLTPEGTVVARWQCGRDVLELKRCHSCDERGCHRCDNGAVQAAMRTMQHVAVTEPQEDWARRFGTMPESPFEEDGCGLAAE